MDPFVKYLNDYRQELKLNHFLFSEKAGLTPAEWSRIYNGKRKVSPGIKLKVFNTLKEKQLEMARFLK